MPNKYLVVSSRSHGDICYSKNILKQSNVFVIPTGAGATATAERRNLMLLENGIGPV